MSEPLHHPMFNRGGSFLFFDPGRLVDGELELVRPSAALLDSWICSAIYPNDPRDRGHEELAYQVRRETQTFLRRAPEGHEVQQVIEGELPTYHFWMTAPVGSPLPRGIAGSINLRINHSFETEQHYGHIGYRVFPHHRGHHYAERSCRLLLPLAQRHRLNPVWITCNPDNLPSRRTCERLGGKLIEIVTLPEGHALRARGETHKCRYRVDL